MTLKTESGSKFPTLSNIIPLNIPKIPLPKFDENWDKVISGDKVIDKSTSLNQEMHFNFSETVKWRENSFSQEVSIDIINEFMDIYLNFIT